MHGLLEKNLSKSSIHLFQYFLVVNIAVLYSIVLCVRRVDAIIKKVFRL